MKLIVITALFALVMFISGCDFRRVVLNKPIHPEKVDFIVPGKTPMMKVVEHLGSPDEISGTSNYLVFRYHFKSAKFFRIDFGYILRIWSPVAPTMSLGNSEAGTDIFLVAFDPNLIAKNHGFSYRANTKDVGFLPF